MENTIQALRGGADDLISKPIELRELRLAPEERPASDKVRVLLVTDTEEPLRPLDAVLSEADFEIDRARTQEEFEAACAKSHDLAIVNQDAKHLRATLPRLRRSSSHTQIPVLVSSLRIEDDPNLAGLLPRYRAMACSPTELRTLMEHRRRVMQEFQAARNLL